MKHRLTYFVIGVLLIGITSCSKPLTHENLVGKWQVVGFDAYVPNINPSIVQGAEEIELSSTYQFFADSTFVRTFVEDESPLNGRYAISDENKTIGLFFDLNNYGLMQEVQSFNGNELEWKEDMGQVGYAEVSLVRIIK